MIDGIFVTLPDKAKYVLQCQRGLWYYVDRKPRLKHGDWTPLKEPIQVTNAQGHIRVLQTQNNNPWQDSIQLVSKSNEQQISC